MQEVIDIIENTKDLLQQKKPDGFESMIDELTRGSALVTSEGVRFDTEKKALLEKLQRYEAVASTPTPAAQPEEPVKEEITEEAKGPGGDVAAGD